MPPRQQLLYIATRWGEVATYVCRLSFTRAPIGDRRTVGLRLRLTLYVITSIL